MSGSYYPVVDTGWFDYPQVWYVNATGNIVQEHNVLPSQIPKIHAFLVPNDKAFVMKPEIFIPWITSRVRGRYRQSHNTRFLLVSMSHDKIREVTFLSHFKELDPSISRISDDAVGIYEIEALSTKLHQHFEEPMTHWQIESLSSMYEGPAEAHFRTCENLLNLHINTLSRVTSIYREPEDILWHILVHLWVTLLKNSTYTHPSLAPDYNFNERCRNSQKVDSHIRSHSKIGYVE